MEPTTFILILVILILSVVIHEISHGYAALWLGDNTAQYAGRLTLNPLKHLDLFGSVIVPLLLSFSGVIFGWAKPVPYNPYNLKNRKWGELIVAMAGPASNILIALIFSLIIRLAGVDSNLVFIAAMIVQVNLVLAVFNLVPIPPLDGSKILFSLLTPKYQYVRTFFERYGLILLILFIFFLWKLVSPIISFLFSAFTGIGYF